MVETSQNRWDDEIDLLVEVSSMSHPRVVAEVLDRDFLETRCRILDIAAALDRLDRAEVPIDAGSHLDRRLDLIRQALGALLEPGPGRAETIQRIFSWDYDPAWPQNLGVERVATL